MKDFTHLALSADSPGLRGRLLELSALGVIRLGEVEAIGSAAEIFLQTRGQILTVHNRALTLNISEMYRDLYKEKRITELTMVKIICIHTHTQSCILSIDISV